MHDAIDRQAAKDAILSCFKTWAGLRTNPMEHDIAAAIDSLPAAWEERWEKLRDELRDSIAWLHASCCCIDTDYAVGKREAYQDCLRELNRLLGDRLSPPAEGKDERQGYQPPPYDAVESQH